MFTHMVSCYHEEALNYKFKHNRANKNLGHSDRVAQWFTTAENQINQISSKRNVGSLPTKVPIFSLTIEVDIESTNRAHIASIVIEGICTSSKAPIKNECGFVAVLTFLRRQKLDDKKFQFITYFRLSKSEFRLSISDEHGQLLNRVNEIFSTNASLCDRHAISGL